MSSSRAKQNRPNRRWTSVYRRGFEDGRRAALEAALSAPEPQPAPSVAPKVTTEALQQFTAYFVKNYPGPDTIIFDPKWHAPKIFRAVVSALSAQVHDVAVLDADEIAAAISTAACELGDIPDPEGDDTISISVRDLEAIAHRHITVAIERAAEPAKHEGSR